MDGGAAIPNTRTRYFCWPDIYTRNTTAIYLVPLSPQLPITILIDITLHLCWLDIYIYIIHTDGSGQLPTKLKSPHFTQVWGVRVGLTQLSVHQYLKRTK